MKRLPPLAALPLALALPLAGQAQSAFVIADASLRAGPAPEYPDITLVPYGTWVDVQGCVGGWQWCDVIVDGDRGWIPGDYIEYVYDSRPVPVVEYGPRIGIPIISFSIVTYWDAHYRHHPFYRERDRWYHRRIVHVAPPPPPPRPPGGWKVPPRSHAPGGSHHVNPPNPPRAPVNPSHPPGGHHANTPKAPPVYAPQPPGEPEHPPQRQHGPPVKAPPHHAATPHPVSSRSHGKPPSEQKAKKKKDNNDEDNGGH